MAHIQQRVVFSATELCCIAYHLSSPQILVQHLGNLLTNRLLLFLSASRFVAHCFAPSIFPIFLFFFFLFLLLLFFICITIRMVCVFGAIVCFLVIVILAIIRGVFCVLVQLNIGAVFVGVVQSMWRRLMNVDRNHPRMHWKRRHRLIVFVLFVFLCALVISVHLTVLHLVEIDNVREWQICRRWIRHWRAHKGIVQRAGVVNEHWLNRLRDAANIVQLRYRRC
mmetsp:Transcript_39777/g.63630  ORF Transcript_39777/g.63630 Transcript_39777/m.63630 type:complete len:224 (+) Transcript_39777:973-1644(+)